MHSARPRVAAHDLCTRLDLTMGLLAEWRRLKKLVPVTKHPQTITYDPADIDRLLQKEARNFPPGQAPTAEALISGTLELIGRAQAMELTGYNKSVGPVARLVRDGEITALKVGLRWYYVKGSVLEYARIHNSPLHMPRDVAGRILGRSVRRINELVLQGRLDAVRTHHRSAPITKASVLRLLEELLEDWIDPASWLDDCLQHTNLPLSFEEARRQLNVEVEKLRALLNSRELLYLRWSKAQGAPYYISPLSVKMLLENEAPLLRDQIANLWGVTRQRINQIGLRCVVHAPDSEEGLRRSCAIALLRPCLSPGIHAAYWYKRRLNNPTPLVPDTDLAQQLGVSPRQVRYWAKKGDIRGVRLKRWRFENSEVERAIASHAAGGLIPSLAVR